MTNPQPAMMTGNIPGAPFSRAALQGQTFSARLVAFHRALAGQDWPVRAPGCAFIRDQDGLPFTAPFDVDIACPASQTEAFTAAFEECARANGITTVIRRHSGGLVCAAFDVVREPGARTWAYYEVFNRIRLTRSRTVEADEIGVVHAAGTLPMPTTGWRFLLEFTQAVRRDRMDRARESLETLRLDDPDAIAFTARELGLAETDVAGALAPGADTAALRSRADILPHGGNKAPQPAGFRDRLRAWLFPRAYFAQIGNPCLYTIHGPDGVGKTTACRLVSEMFAQYPIGFASQHHVTGWKEKPSDAPAPPKAAAPRRPLPRRMVSAAYRNAPSIVRRTWYTMSGYHRYSRNVMAMVYRYYVEGRVILVDRYIYDMWVKPYVTADKDELLPGIGARMCRLLRRPRLAFVLNDTPLAIHGRKQELSVEEIAAFQNAMDEILTRCDVRTNRIDVGGLGPDAVAARIVTGILENLGDEVLNVMRDFIQRQDKAPATAS